LELGAFGLPINEALFVFLQNGGRHFLGESRVVQLLPDLFDFGLVPGQFLRQPGLFRFNVKSETSGRAGGLK